MAEGRLVVEAPSSDAPPTALADVLELEAIRAGDRDSSMQQLERAIQRLGTVEDGPEKDAPEWRSASEKIEALAADAVSEISRRQIDAADRYPFRVADQLVLLDQPAVFPVYVFLLLLSKFGHKAGPKGSNPVVLFEELCRSAAAGYLGGKPYGRAVRFGSPRRAPMPANFKKALAALCGDLRDGAEKQGVEIGNAAIKDGALDIVAWRDFPDGRRGKVIAFGQCYAGREDLLHKARELDPTVFMGNYFRDHPAVGPVKLYFVSQRVSSGDWDSLAREGGILFDRCRIAYFADPVEEKLLNEVRKWNEHVVARLDR